MRSSALSLSLGIVGLLLLSGCHHHPRGVYHRDVQPMFDDAGQARSLVLTTPQVHAAKLLPPGQDAWYAGRNDVGPSVIAGYESVTFTQSITTTRDRRVSRGGRVYEDYDETTRLRTYRESTR